MSSHRIGQGWDVHRIVTGRSLILGGVTIPADFGLDGHSDADVVSHAITDAILGAISAGDIGMHFPDTDPQWKGQGSLLFLKHACHLADQAGYAVVNVDSTIILERPRLKDYRLAMRESLAAAMNLDVSAVSVKFKTAERVGPVGQGESAESQAVILLVSKP